MFTRSTADLASCAQHLEDTGSVGTPIEKILVGYVLTVIHAEFEQAIRGAVRERCAVEGDPHLTAFTGNAATRVIRSIRISELSGALGLFDASCKESFQAAVNGSQAETYYGNIESNRQLLAHESGSMATMTEVREWFEAAGTVVTVFREVLGLSPNG